MVAKAQEAAKRKLTIAIQAENARSRTLDVRVSGRLVTDNGEVIRDALLAGFGIALKSTWDVAPFLRSGELVSVLDSYPLAEKVAIWAVYPSRAFVPPKTLAFIDFLAGQFGDPPYWDAEPA